jgi:ATP adenylyltransferase
MDTAARPHGFHGDLIRAAESDPDAVLDLADRASEVSRLFGDEEGLLLSLRQRWMTMLVAKLDQAAHEELPADQARADLAAAQPGLHALVQIAARRSLRVRALSSGERRAMDLFSGLTSSRLTVA